MCMHGNDDEPLSDLLDLTDAEIDALLDNLPQDLSLPWTWDPGDLIDDDPAGEATAAPGEATAGAGAAITDTRDQGVAWRVIEWLGSVPGIHMLPAIRVSSQAATVRHGVRVRRPSLHFHDWSRDDEQTGPAAALCVRPVAGELVPLRVHGTGASMQAELAQCLRALREGDSAVIPILVRDEVQRQMLAVPVRASAAVTTSMPAA